MFLRRSVYAVLADVCRLVMYILGAKNYIVFASMF